MRKAILLLLLAVLLITSAIVSYFFVTERVYPHTYLGKYNAAGLQSREVDALLEQWYGATFSLKVKDRIYPFTYKKLGILIDKKATERTLFQNNGLPFPGNIIRYAGSLRSQNMILPVLVFTQDFSNFTQSSVFDFTAADDQYRVDDDEKAVIFTDNQERYRIDPEHLKSLLTFHFGDRTATYEPKLVRLTDGKKQQTVSEQNRLIQQVFSFPLSVVVQDAGLTSVSFSPDDLKKMFGIRWGSRGVEFVPQSEAIGYRIDAKVDPLVSRNRSYDKNKMKADITAAFMARTTGVSSGPVLVKTSEMSPTVTHGDIAERYVEIDISQQKMYLFYQGQVVKAYTVSTGLYYPTPVGHFHIMNKAEEGYSDIFNVYMPWWMAFYYGWAGGQDAYFGIHELPYWYVGFERKQRPREFLGSPHTGGCVSLDIGAAKEVYDFSFVGMDVVIFN